MAAHYIVPTIKWVKPNEGQIENIENMVTNDAAFATIKCSFGDKSPEILLDFGKKVTGYLEIKTRGHSSDAVILSYGPVESCLHMPSKIDMPVHNIYCGDHYIACRYIKLSMQSKSIQPMDIFMNIESIGLISSQYPCSYTGAFECDDERLNRIWEYGSYTLELCMQKQSESAFFRTNSLPQHMRDFADSWKGRYSDYVLFDGPRRDREAWLGDIRTEALTAYTSFGAYDVAKSSLDLFYELQRKDGSTAGSGTTWMNFIEYNFWWVIAIWENYLYTGDKNFLEHIRPGVKNLVSFIDRKMDPRGFIYNDGNWMWTLPREGYSSGAQAILYMALKCASFIENEFFNYKEADRLLKLSEKVKENINLYFWDEEKGIYHDDLRIVVDEKPVLLDVNCYVIVFGIAGPEKAKRILSYLKENMWCDAGSTTLDKKILKAELEEGIIQYPLIDFVKGSPDPVKTLLGFMYPHNKQVWPFINGYEVEARFIAGDIEGAFELIKRCWGHEYFDETKTFWEMVDAQAQVFNARSMYTIPKDDCFNSAAHGWSGWISYLLQTYVIGIRPVMPGFQKTIIRPATGALKNVKGSIPTPYGIIDVEIIKEDQKYSIHIKKPKTIESETELSDTELGGRVVEIQTWDC